MELSIPSTPTPTPTPERISFAPGQDTAERSGPLTANRAKQYIFRAQAGQEAQILMDSPSTTTGFALEGMADGITYKSMSDPERAYALTLPRSQDYLITILATVNTSYYLELAIPGSPGPTPPPGPPERISFAPGADTAIRNGSLSANTPKQYIFRAQAGQTAQVSLSATSSTANFSVEGVSDGNIYKPMDDMARVFSFTLPRTQDYLITLLSPTSTSYRLELYVPTTPVPTPPPEPAERISFSPGSDSAVRGGPLYANTPKTLHIWRNDRTDGLHQSGLTQS